jgi:hypothetical protein
VNWLRIYNLLAVPLYFLISDAGAFGQQHTLASYIASTGEIRLDVGPSVTVIGFGFANGWNQQNLTIDPPGLGPVFTSPTTLEFLDVNGLQPGRYSLGALLPAGIKRNQIGDYTIFNAFGPGVSVIGPVGWVPEPAANILAVLMFSMLFLLARSAGYREA